MRLATRRQRTIGRDQWPSGRRVVLHVGCGPRSAMPLPERFRSDVWHEVRLDINPDVDPDIVADIVDMPIVASRSVDAVYSSHNLEHVFGHQVHMALSEFRRVLVPEAIAHVQVPDVMVPVRAIAKGNLERTLYESTAGGVTPLDMLFGHGPAIASGEHMMAHRTAFTRETLTAKLSEAGFEEVRVTAPGDNTLWATARRPREN